MIIIPGVDPHLIFEVDSQQCVKPCANAENHANSHPGFRFLHGESLILLCGVYYIYSSK